MTTTFERVERRLTVTIETVWHGDDPSPVRKERTVETMRYRVTGAGAVTMFARDRRPTARLYVPTGVLVTVRGSTLAPDVHVTGSLRRKDGTLADAVVTIHRYTWGARVEWPAWLSELVRAATL